MDPFGVSFREFIRLGLNAVGARDVALCAIPLYRRSRTTTGMTRAVFAS